jgi:hypothetical protein
MQENLVVNLEDSNNHRTEVGQIGGSILEAVNKFENASKNHSN